MIFVKETGAKYLTMVKVSWEQNHRKDKIEPGQNLDSMNVI